MIFCVLFWGVQELFMRKDFWELDGWAKHRVPPLTNIVGGFYEEPANSVDVLFLGSSNVFCNVNPLLLFKEEGITAYDFASGAQRLEVSYFFLKEALKKQRLKAVIIDVLAISYQDDRRSEVDTHGALDNMPMSLAKMEVIKNMLKNDSRIYYLLPITKYHNKWKELTSKDWLNLYKERYYPFKGQLICYNIEPMVYGKSLVELKEIPLCSKQALDNIVELCKKENIPLLFIKTPNTKLWCQQYSDLAAKYAEEKGVPFIDYNAMMDDIIDKNKDSFDGGYHLNDTGAIKLTRHLGKYLKEHYNLPDHRGEAAYASWNDDWIFYQQDKAAYFLSHETDWQAYVEKLKNPYYTIYITAKDNIGGEKHRELVEKLSELGVTSEINDKGAWSYQAILDKGNVVYERLSQEMLEYRDKVNGHRVSMVSAGHDSGNRGRILIDYKDYFVDKRGIGIVVYDNVFNEVVDSVTFDLFDGGKAYRDKK
jgi:hypothetical protein